MRFALRTARHYDGVRDEGAFDDNALTDVLIRRGDVDVSNALAQNLGAHFSEKRSRHTCRKSGARRRPD